MEGEFSFFLRAAARFSTSTSLFLLFPPRWREGERVLPTTTLRPLNSLSSCCLFCTRFFSGSIVVAGGGGDGFVNEKKLKKGKGEAILSAIVFRLFDEYKEGNGKGTEILGNKIKIKENRAGEEYQVVGKFKRP